MLAMTSAALLALVPSAYAAGSQNLAFTPTVPSAEKAGSRTFGGNGAPPSHAVPLVSTDTVKPPLGTATGIEYRGDASNATRIPITTSASPRHRSQRWSNFFRLLICSCGCDRPLLGN